jgi:predicted aspartyl protease
MMNMGHPRYSKDEIVRRGKEWYEREIRAKVEEGNKGKILVIDIETGEYEMDDDHLAANQRAREASWRGTLRDAHRLSSAGQSRRRMGRHRTMITGVVTANREAVVRLKLRDVQGAEVEIDTILDTGFTESLSLPRTWVNALVLAFIEEDEMILADGSLIRVDLYEGIVLWDGQERTVVVHCMEGSPLIGMSLIYDHLLTMQVVDGGDVTIDAMP